MCDATPSLVQSRTLKDMSRNGTLTENYLHTLLTEEKPNQRQKFFLNQSDVQQYFPIQLYTAADAECHHFAAAELGAQALQPPAPTA